MRNQVEVVEGEFGLRRHQTKSRSTKVTKRQILQRSRDEK